MHALNRAYLSRLLSLGVGGDEHGTKLQELASAMSDGDVADAKRGALQWLALHTASQPQGLELAPVRVH